MASGHFGISAMKPGSLRYTSSLDRAAFEECCNRLRRWYHSYYFDNGFSVRGDYDIGADIGDYGLPPDLRGLRVLDVGTGAGWFAHHFAQCGAKVTTVDVRGYVDFDRFGQDYESIETEKDRPDRFVDGRPIYDSPVSAAFWIMEEVLGSGVRFVNSRIYDLTPQLFDGDTFDLVFIGSLLLHLRDPIGALMAAKRVCHGMIVAATPVQLGGDTEPWPVQYLSWTDIDTISWWLPNEKAFQKWFEAAGLRDIDVGRSVLLRADKSADDGTRPVGDQIMRVGRAWVPNRRTAQLER